MNHLGAILHHLIAGVFDVSARTAIAGRKANQFRLSVRVDAESPFPVSHGTQTLAPRTTPVAIADNDTDLCLGIHIKAFYLVVDEND
jgi:hypothetical protein